MCTCISSCNSDAFSDSHSLQSMGPLNDGDNGALLPQDPNVQMDRLIVNVTPTTANTTTPPTSASGDVISPVPPSPKEASAAGVNGKTTLTCSICDRLYPRRGRAEACENMHQGKRPYACRNACGTSDWYVLVYPHPVAIGTFFSSASFPSKAGLNRHCRAVGTRNRACRQWCVELFGGDG
jgi:hypothetical protein